MKEVITSYSHYPFGMLMPGRVNSYGTGTSYRYAYNGMELDNEVSGNGNSYTTEFRQYDPRLGRWKSLDPLMSMFPNMSPYVAFDNNPVYYTDPLGLASEVVNDGVDPPPGLSNQKGEFKEGDYKELPEMQASHTRSPEEVLKSSQNTYLKTRPIPESSMSDATNVEIKPIENNIIYEHKPDRIKSTPNSDSYELAVRHGQTIKKSGHGILDAAGLIPIVGEPADIINSAWYASQGDYTNAGLSLAGAVPFLGWISAGTKYALKTASFAGEIVYKSSEKMLEAGFKLLDGNSVGILADATRKGKELILSDVVLYGMNKAGKELGGGDLGAKTVVELRQAVNAWAKEQGFEKITYIGKRAVNSSSANPGSVINKTFDLTK